MRKSTKSSGGTDLFEESPFEYDEKKYCKIKVGAQLPLFVELMNYFYNRKTNSI